jgi:hypothetical protein
VFADANYDPARFLAYYDSLEAHFIRYYEAEFDTVPPAVRAEDRMGEIYFVLEGQDFREVFMQEANSKTDQFYEIIAAKSYVQGWLDCEPTFQEIEEAEAGDIDTIVGSFGQYVLHDSPDSVYIVEGIVDGTNLGFLYGYSEDRGMYVDMVAGE